MRRRTRDYEALRNALAGRRITEWDENYIILDNGMRLVVEMTESDCCAWAYGKFSDVVLDAAITHVSDIKYTSWNDGDTYGCSAEVTIMHNRNRICQIIGNADAGNGGYYYSIASFVVHPPEGEPWQTDFVGSEDKGDEDEPIRVDLGCCPGFSEELEI